MKPRETVQKKLKRPQYESHMELTDKKLRSRHSRRNRLLRKMTYKIRKNKNKKRKRKRSKLLKSLSLILDDCLHQILESLIKSKGPRSQMSRTQRNSKMPFSLRRRVVVIKMTYELPSSVM